MSEVPPEERSASDTSAVFRSDWALFMYPFAVVALIGFVVFSALAVAHGQFVMAIVIACGFAYSAHQIGWRIAYELRTSETEVRWRAPFASGVVARSDLSTWHTGFFELDVTVLVNRNGRNVLVRKAPGLKNYLATHVFDPDEDDEPAEA